MMFENFSQLKSSMNSFIAGQSDYEYPHPPMHYEKWVQETAVSLEKSMTLNSTKD